jgi:hypothetical protein
MIANQILDSIFSKRSEKKYPSSRNTEVGRRRLWVAFGMDFGESGKRDMDVV